ncbi:unnamed protein product (macronuclear) [Paramecium tetraurelia]|uniref:Uncharacterized protein n=1 Tax=Paramecium tetraurelia TaxID=5888 RepID=A0CM26_PARTE|nr:uncharacterized protein GSPATT00008322001 [Paramecium tetraurelia]CAK71843.1 unnamed protein product [Paramecium tetraurelia]|eukprot:XP_001439240.1 hypothetical protein (macronuclear) [Paramecium tetraurelia strain d4-2]
MSEKSQTQKDYQQENQLIKQQLLQYWVKISKTLDDEYEEILQLGSNSDPNDIINALFIIEDARQEQQKVQLLILIQLDKQQLDTLKKQIESQNEKIITLQQQHEKQPQVNNKQEFNPEIRQLEMKINELSLALVKSKEEKIIYMEQAQKQIQLLKEQKLELKSKIQRLQFEQSKKSSFAEPEENLGKSSKEYIEDDITRQSVSPQTQKIKLDYSKLSLNQNLKKLTKVDQVQGTSLTSFRFGNK